MSPGLPRGLQALHLFCGPTFLERLWCLLEIFVYLEMGGRVDDVTLVLAPPDDAYFEERFARFDVSHATCFDPVEPGPAARDHRGGLRRPRAIQRVAQGRRRGSAEARRGHPARP